MVSSVKYLLNFKLNTNSKRCRRHNFNHTYMYDYTIQNKHLKPEVTYIL